MSDNKAINPPTSPPWIVDETAPSNLIVTSDTVMVEREVDADISIDQPPPPPNETNPMLNLLAVKKRGEKYTIWNQLKIYGRILNICY